MASSIEYLNECSICMTEYTDPQMLPCQHTFCKQCVDKLKTLRCPLCQTYFKRHEVKRDFKVSEYVNALKKNKVEAQRVINPDIVVKETCELCEEYQVSQICEDCQQAMCKRCRKIHIRSKPCKSHHVVSVQDKWKEIEPFCRAHKQKLQQTLTASNRAQQLFNEDIRKLCEIEQAALDKAKNLERKYRMYTINKFKRVKKSIRSYVGKIRSEAETKHKVNQHQRRDICNSYDEFKQHFESKSAYFLLNYKKIIEETSNFADHVFYTERMPEIHIDVLELEPINVNTAVEVVMSDMVESENQTKDTPARPDAEQPEEAAVEDSRSEMPQGNAKSSDEARQEVQEEPGNSPLFYPRNNERVSSVQPQGFAAQLRRYLLSVHLYLHILAMLWIIVIV